MKILCLTPWFPNSPGDREGNYIYDSVMALREDDDIAVTVFLVRSWKPWEKSSPKFYLFPKDLSLTMVKVPSIPRNYFRSMSNDIQYYTLYNRLSRFVRKHAIQIIHAHTEGLASVAVAVAKSLGVRVVVTIHGVNTSHRYMGTLAQRKYFRCALDSADRIILVGEPLRDYFLDLVGKDSHFSVVHNGFRLPVKSHPRVLFTMSTRKLISVSNLHEGKGIDITLKALKILKNKGVKDWHYTIIGDGYMREKWEALSKLLGLEKHVTFVGSVDHVDVAEHLLHADIFVLPSYREAFGVAYLEAMACGLLTIGVKGQGAAEFIQHGKNGFLVLAKDIEDLAEYLQFILDNTDSLQDIAEEGRNTAVNDFNWSSHAQALKEEYSKLLTFKVLN